MLERIDVRSKLFPLCCEATSRERVSAFFCVLFSHPFLTIFPMNFPSALVTTQSILNIKDNALNAVLYTPISKNIANLFNEFSSSLSHKMPILSNTN